MAVREIPYQNLFQRATLAREPAAHMVLLWFMLRAA